MFRSNQHSQSGKQEKNWYFKTPGFREGEIPSRQSTQHD